MKEIWKGVIYQGKDYSGFYEVSNTGKLRNAKTKREVKLNIGKTGYYVYTGGLGSRKLRKTFKLHKCLMEAFVPNIQNKPFINHKDGNKLNNSFDNLEWCTGKENVQHSYDTGLRIEKTGAKRHGSKLTEEDVVFIKANYKPRDRKLGTRGMARKFNVDHKVIVDVLKNRKY